ncbi:MAG: rhomboid family intramembrane serine protease [Bacteroidota bacterium]|nr:rhomboid family intramembrane serine protease [Bacteroidota bacterium]
MTDSRYSPTGFKLLPEAVKNIIIINALFFLGSIAFSAQWGIDAADYLGLHYWGSEKFKPYQLITYMFMHGSFSHILFNMFAVWMFGYVLENIWGPKRFLIFYFVCGLGAALTHYVVLYYTQLSPMLNEINQYSSDPIGFIHSAYFQLNSSSSSALQELVSNYNFAVSHNNITEATDFAGRIMDQYKTDFLNMPNVIGASGAVFGILLAFGMMFPNQLIFLYFFFPMKAKYFVILYGALELWGGISNNMNDNVAHFAHLGGMLFGFILIKIWQKKKSNGWS